MSSTYEESPSAQKPARAQRCVVLRARARMFARSARAGCALGARSCARSNLRATKRANGLIESTYERAHGAQKRR
ncbi:MAG TPA: hypothetical protein VHC22_32660 [Pirellulales bacterium]|nr:hypothetical protein [Pirellulales bacterium]